MHYNCGSRRNSRHTLVITRKTIFVSLRPNAARWNVALSSELPSFLVGWRISREADIDGSVPGEICRALAETLCSLGTVGFIGSDPGVPAGHLRDLMPASWLERLRLVIRHRITRLWLTSTRDPEVARLLFEEPQFPWWMRTQLALLFEADDPSEFSASELLECADPRVAIDRAKLDALGAAAFMRAGIDGDVALIAANSDTLRMRISKRLEREAIAAGFEWCVLADDAFTDALAAPWAGPLP